jgi:hypothetical protein
MKTNELKKNVRPGMVIRACNPSYSEVEIGGLLFKASLGKKVSEIFSPQTSKHGGVHCNPIYTRGRSRRIRSRPE